MLLCWAYAACLPGNLHAQSKSTFTVIKVHGSIYSTVLKRAIAIGDVVSGTDKLKFDSNTSYIHVINSTHELKTVRDVPDDSPRELMALLQSFINDKMPLSSRGADPGIEKIIHQFSYDAILLLGDGRMTFKKEDLSLKSPAGVKVSYLLDGTKVEKLISDETGFNLGKNFVFDSDLEVFPKVKVIYYEELDNWPFAPLEILGEFTPVYVNEKSLGAELKILIDALSASGANAKDIETNVVLYLKNEYEAPLLSNLRDWLSANKLMTY